MLVPLYIIMRVFENRALSGIFRPKRKQRELEKSQQTEVSEFVGYSLLYIIRVIKSRKMRCAGHVAHMGEMRNSHTL
jgi:hypothetical protein